MWSTTAAAAGLLALYSVPLVAYNRQRRRRGAGKPADYLPGAHTPSLLLDNFVFLRAVYEQEAAYPALFAEDTQWHLLRFVVPGYSSTTCSALCIRSFQQATTAAGDGPLSGQTRVWCGIT